MVDPLFNLDHEETLKFEDAVDALNMQERQEQTYERFMFPGKGDDRIDNLAVMINNHSIMIKSKERKTTESLLRDMKVDVDTDQDNVTTRRMEVEVIDRREEKKRNLNQKTHEVEEKFKSRFDKQKQVELENVWKDFVNERKKRRDRKMAITRTARPDSVP